MTIDTTLHVLLKHLTAEQLMLMLKNDKCDTEPLFRARFICTATPDDGSFMQYTYDVDYYDPDDGSLEHVYVHVHVRKDGTFNAYLIDH